MNKLPNSGDLPLPEPTGTVAASVDILNCTTPATARIEVYVPREGLDGYVLDSVMHLCDRHAQEILEVISWDTGDVRTERTALAEHDKPCGSSWDFGAIGAMRRQDVELVRRLDAKVRDVERRERKAFASGYIQGVTARLTGTGHAFTVVADDTEADKFMWLCRCGWMTIQYPAGTEQDPIHKRLTDHVFEATAVDERTATALEVEGCSCPAEIPDGHKHILYVRRLASTGKLAHIVVKSNARGTSAESLCWPISEAGIARAQEWCDRHGAEWDNGERVKAGDLIARGQGWLS